MSGKPLVVILGATAVGKTGFAIEAARTLNGEIVSTDSRQVYRYMDIGTAKPTPEQRAVAPHHLIDVVEPDNTLSLAQFQEMAYAAINDIHGRGRLPLLVGGTGQYITATVEGWTVPEVEPKPELRAELEAYAAEHGERALFDRLLALDPDSAEIVDYRNVRRVVRAIEVSLVTGKPFTQQRQKQPPPYRILQIGLTMDRERLYQRADQRFDEMIAQGFRDEVSRLHEMGYERHLPSMSALGYREMMSHLLDGVPLDETVAAAKYATHQFIRRQYTWFRGHDDGIHWFDVESSQPHSLTEMIAAWLETEIT